MRSGFKGLIAAWALSTTFGTASGQQPDQTNFLTEAIRGSVAEAKLGQLAAERAQSLQVRQYGEMLRKDHTQSLERASGLANEIGVPAATELSARQQKQFESLQKLSGEEFDTTFLSQMVRDHQENIAKFSAEAQDGSNPRSWRSRRKPYRRCRRISSTRNPSSRTWRPPRTGRTPASPPLVLRLRRRWGAKCPSFNPALRTTPARAIIADPAA